FLIRLDPKLSIRWGFRENVGNPDFPVLSVTVFSYRTAYRTGRNCALHLECQKWLFTMICHRWRVKQLRNILRLLTTASPRESQTTAFMAILLFCCFFRLLML